MLLALSVHEWAHAYVAYRLGDSTAKMAGRMTLNPLAHLDPFGTLFFLLVGFGWGKPVPVYSGALRHPKRDEALVSLAGPASNLALALISYPLLALVERLSLPGVLGTFLLTFLSLCVTINLALMAFNLLPIAPLDGSKILGAFIPLRYEDAYDQFLRWGLYILLGLLIAEQTLGVPLLSLWIGGISGIVLSLAGMVFGQV